MKKVICILLTLALLAACLPATALAADTPKKAIIVIPGMTGSELYTGEEDDPTLVWVDASSLLGLLKMSLIACDENGEPKNDVFPVDDTRSPYGPFYKGYVYKTLIDTLRGKYDAKYGGDGSYEVRFLSYDWRLSSAVSADRLHNFIEENGYDEVVLIGHSNGGMASVSYLAKYGYDKVEKVITLGTPYMGAPKALYALEMGRYVDDPATYSLVKPLAPNVPSMYELLPTSAYIEKLGGYIYDGTLSNQQTLADYEAYLKQSTWCNQKLKAKADAFFTENLGKYSLDTVYQDMQSGKVASYLVVGSGCSTIGGYVMKDGEIDDVLLCDGDGTLPLESATMGQAEFQRAPYCVQGINHNGLVMNPEPIQMLLNFVDNKEDYLDGCGELSVTRTPEKEENEFYKVTATGSVQMEVFDAEGNLKATVADGVITCEADTENVCHILGDKKFIYINKEGYTVSITGKKAGTTDLTVQKLSTVDGKYEIVSAIGYDAVPVTTNTTLTLKANVDGENTLSIDKDSNGTVDETLVCRNFGKSQFRDVITSDYFYDPVLWAVEKNVTTGISDTVFGPLKACTRAQVVTFLWRAAGCPEPKTSQCPFTDVPADSYYRDAVLWAVGENITTGTSKTTFSPNATVTRGQTAAFLYRLAKPGKAEKTADFKDVSPNEYFYDAVQWAYANKITTGTSATTFSPNNSCLRGQIVTFLYRYFVQSVNM